MVSTCLICKEIFATRKARDEHIKEVHRPKSLTCQFCGKISKNFAGAFLHERYCKENPDDSLKIYHAPKKDN